MNRLLVKYRELAAMHGNHTMAGDVDKANRAHRELQNVLADLVVDENLGQLFFLYEDDDRFVQLWVASHTLKLDGNRACAKLQELSELKIPMVSMSAHRTIRAWREGVFRGSLH